MTSDLSPDRETGLAEESDELDLAGESSTVTTTTRVPQSDGDASVTTQVVPTQDDDDGIQGETS